MEGVGGRFTEKIQALSDIELAVLICLVADQHCAIECDSGQMNGLDHELQIVR